MFRMPRQTTWRGNEKQYAARVSIESSRLTFAAVAVVSFQLSSVSKMKIVHITTGRDVYSITDDALFARRLNRRGSNRGDISRAWMG